VVLGTKSEEVKTEFAECGLRYTSKKAGSMFGGMGGLTFGGSSMSCFKCGAHRSMLAMVSKKILGKSRKVCGEGCKRP
jgi:hypothetical protein